MLTEDRQAIDTKFLGFTVSPHEECAVEEAVRLVEAHGGELDRPDAGARGRRRAAARRDRHGRRPRRSCSRPATRNGTPVATAAAIVDAVRAEQEAARGYDRPALRQRGGRHRRLPGGDPRGARARPALRDRHQGARGGGRTARRRGARAVGRVGDLRDCRCPAVFTVKEGINLPRYPSVPGRMRAKKKEIERDRARAAAGRRLERVRLKLPPEQDRRGRDPRRRSRGRAGRRRRRSQRLGLVDR